MWDLDDAPIVDGAFCGIEIGVSPNRDQFRIPDRVGPGRFGDVNRVVDRRLLAVRTRFAVSGPDHVVDFLVCLFVCVEPALNDLDSVEIFTVGILGHRDQERRRFPSSIN